MINLLLGAPGGGKSYEATVFHILPAILAGRRVVTNLPLSVEAFEGIAPGAAALIDVRTTGLGPPDADGRRPPLFGHVFDYEDPWRHPVGGHGPLYVVDECHIPLPVKGTPISVEEWYSLHRHQRCDVLLITQSYGKISTAIRDLVQIVYRVRKNIALGSTGSYTRKVQDGIRGEVVNTTIRKYEPKNYRFYRSHTQGSAGSELGASDIKPIWQNWTFIGAAIMAVIFVGMLSGGMIKSPLSASPADPKGTTTASTPPAPRPALAVPVKTPQSPAQVAQAPEPKDPAQATTTPPAEKLDEFPEPLANLTVHLIGSIKMGTREKHLFKLAQNGQFLREVDDTVLRDAGYTFESAGLCGGWLRYTKAQGLPPRSVTCNAPGVSPTMVGTTRTT